MRTMSVFIVSIDGPDFSGKTTISNLLVERFRKEFGKSIVIKRTSLPSDTITGIVPKILRSVKTEIDSRVFSLAYALDHLHHYNVFIKPLIESKRKYLVVMERSLLSTYIYQGIIGSVDMRWLKKINAFCRTRPDLTVILKVEESELLKRIKLERREFDKFETEQHVLKQARAYYNLPASLRREFRVSYVDANRDPPLVVESIYELALPKLRCFIRS